MRSKPENLAWSPWNPKRAVAGQKYYRFVGSAFGHAFLEIN